MKTAKKNTTHASNLSKHNVGNHHGKNMRQKVAFFRRKGLVLTKLAWRPIGIIVVVLLLVMLLAPMFSGTIVKSAPVAFTKQTIADSTVELGDTKTIQTGTNGIQIITYSEPKSLLNLIFGGGSIDELKETSSVTTKQPVTEIIGSGTRKYQYMYCSDGTYRYYTDAQFKDPRTGFTHKSPDDCAKSNHGTATQLADTPPRPAVSNVTSLIPFSNFVVPSCTTTLIPYGIDYQNVSWLPVGQTETFPGLNGTYFSCLGTTVQPLNEVIYTGTGQDYNAIAQQQASDLARQKCTAQYNSVMAQINAAGAGSSSAVTMAQYAYRQCLNASGL